MMKKALALTILLFAKTAYAMNEMIRVSTSDNQTFEISKSEARLFGTIKDCIDGQGLNEIIDGVEKVEIVDGKSTDQMNQKKSIPLRNISSAAWLRLMQDLPRVVGFYKNSDKNEHDTIMRIVGCPQEHREWRINYFLQNIEIPPYDPALLAHSIEGFKTANYLQAPEFCTLYAKMVAGLSISDAALKQLYENPEQHPLMGESNVSSWSSGLKSLIHACIPQIGKDRLTIQHVRSVLSGSFSHDDTMILTTSSDGIARVTQLSTGKHLCEIRHNHKICSGDFSPDDTHIVTGSHDDTVRETEIVTGKKTLEYRHGGSVDSVAYSPNGKYIITTSYDKRAIIIDRKTRQVVRYIAHGDGVYKGLFLPDNKHVITASYFDNDVRKTNIETGESNKIKCEKCRVDSISPDGNNLLARHDHVANVIDISTGRTSQYIAHSYKNMTLTGPNVVTAGSFSHDGTMALTVSCDGIDIRDIASNRTVYEIKPNNNERFDSGSFSHDGTMIIATVGNTARVIEPTDTFEQAILAYLTKWCKKNNKSFDNENAWVKRVNA